MYVFSGTLKDLCRSCTFPHFWIGVVRYHGGRVVAALAYHVPASRYIPTQYVGHTAFEGVRLFR